MTILATRGISVQRQFLCTPNKIMNIFLCTPCCTHEMTETRQNGAIRELVGGI